MQGKCPSPPPHCLGYWDREGSSSFRTPPHQVQAACDQHMDGVPASSLLAREGAGCGSVG